MSRLAVVPQVPMTRKDDFVLIGRRIAQAREEARLTQAELGQQIGVSDATVNRWENAVTRIDIITLRDVARILGKPTAWFLGEEIGQERLFGWRLGELTEEQREALSDMAETMRRRRRESRNES